ncbi:MAG: metal-dependent transcriptional regulator [Abditibacteriales bacterium]|nr:metal-dependent transcriptional regulator [Abditibacteriales bacterium]MDW8364437.1 metal-dependent transcriptional regulator [Abditibacteriales bacterium]
MLSQAVEDYLKVIYKLQRENERVTTTDLAKAMKVSPASVTNMVKKLAKMRLVQHTSYQGVGLTKAGEKVALEVVRHHRLLELYLKEALGYSWDQVHDEAEKLEHHISEEFEERIFEALGRPAFDPHGDPIPTKDGKIQATDFDPLSEAEPGDVLVIRRVDDGDPELLRYLAELGLTPMVTIEVMSKQPFNGPLIVRVGESQHAVGREVARNIFVTPAEKG